MADSGPWWESRLTLEGRKKKTHGYPRVLRAILDTIFIILLYQICIRMSTTPSCIFKIPWSKVLKFQKREKMVFSPE